MNDETRMTAEECDRLVDRLKDDASWGNPRGGCAYERQEVGQIVALLAEKDAAILSLAEQAGHLGVDLAHRDATLGSVYRLTQELAEHPDLSIEVLKRIPDCVFATLRSIEVLSRPAMVPAGPRRCSICHKAPCPVPQFHGLNAGPPNSIRRGD